VECLSQSSYISRALQVRFTLSLDHLARHSPATSSPIPCPDCVVGGRVPGTLGESIAAVVLYSPIARVDVGKRGCRSSASAPSSETRGKPNVPRSCSPLKFMRRSSATAPMSCWPCAFCCSLVFGFRSCFSWRTMAWPVREPCWTERSVGRRRQEPRLIGRWKSPHPVRGVRGVGPATTDLGPSSSPRGYYRGQQPRPGMSHASRRADHNGGSVARPRDARRMAVFGVFARSLGRPRFESTSRSCGEAVPTTGMPQPNIAKMTSRTTARKSKAIRQSRAEDPRWARIVARDPRRRTGKSGIRSGRPGLCRPFPCPSRTRNPQTSIPRHSQRPSDRLPPVQELQSGRPLYRLR